MFKSVSHLGLPAFVSRLPSLTVLSLSSAGPLLFTPVSPSVHNMWWPFTQHCITTIIQVNNAIKCVCVEAPLRRPCQRNLAHGRALYYSLSDTHFCPAAHQGALTAHSVKTFINKGILCHTHKRNLQLVACNFSDCLKAKVS